MININDNIFVFCISCFIWVCCCIRVCRWKYIESESANYPFCTIEPNKAVVPVPDPRLEELAKIVNPERIQHSTVDFVDIAGLVKGASVGYRD